MLNKTLLVLILGLFTGLASASAQTPTSTPARVKGRILAARVQGQVTAVAKATGATTILKDGDSVTDQTRIVTGAGASVILVFSNGATVDIAGDSTLDIEDFEQDPFAETVKVADLKQEPGTSTTRLSLTKGELVGKVVHLNVDKGSEFTVQTPVGAAGIRGTTFMIVYNPGPNGTATFSIETSDGSVVFTTAAGTFDVPAGQQITETFDINSGQPTTPILLTDLPPIEAAQIQVISQTIVQAYLNILFPPLAPPPAPPAPGGPPPAGSDSSASGTPSSPTASPPSTTPGAGGP
jgi:hypothetical protein